MVRYYIAGGIIAASVIIYALIQCILSDARRVRSISKPAWILTIVLLPLLGALLWFWLGRPLGAAPATGAAGNSGYYAPGRSTAPDDDDAFLRQLERQRELKKREEELKRREEELKKREKDAGNDPQAD
ncbi:PLDc N-terminal domain-containing protein [Neomicrococcus lactis]|uniref:Cardiolipin synthase N-terminal domain-containing protein n=1 Tax=Neomicrococcus lactis TaxID=732241 RepID=A0A7W8Y8M9_9MICC|nr:PLDc N-terminal domain-containing protein [Neomicrococcus lactis]MBB5596939.1 hypothetical protein [Neomicrococcus lactis]